MPSMHDSCAVNLLYLTSDRIWIHPILALLANVSARIDQESNICK